MFFVRPPLERRDRLRRAHAAFYRIFTSVFATADAQMSYDTWFNAYRASLMDSGALPCDVETHLRALFLDAVPRLNNAACTGMVAVRDADGRMVGHGDCVRLRDGSMWACADRDGPSTAVDVHGRMHARGFVRMDDVPAHHNTEAASVVLWVDATSGCLVGGHLLDLV